MHRQTLAGFEGMALAYLAPILLSRNGMKLMVVTLGQFIPPSQPHYSCRTLIPKLCTLLEDL